jgi:hypothetical protein
MSQVTVLYGGEPFKASKEELRRLYWRQALGMDAVYPGGVIRSYGPDAAPGVVREHFGFSETFGGYINRVIRDRFESMGGSSRAKCTFYRRAGTRLSAEQETLRERRTKLYRSRRVAEAMERKAKRNLPTAADRLDLGLRLLLNLRSSPSLSLGALSRVVREDARTIASALARLEDAKLVRSHRSAYSCTKRGVEVLKEFETMLGVSLEVPSKSGEDDFRDLILGSAVYKRGGFMNNAHATATALARDVVEADPIDEVLGKDDEQVNNPNYRAYLREVDELESSGERFYVAYANGRRIAKEKTYKELLVKIGDRDDDVLIQEVPDEEINLHRPFRVED